MELLTQNEIEYFKNHQNEITRDLLDALRKTKPGKHQALEILDCPKDIEGYYLDAFNNRISLNGDRTLKKPFTPLKLSDIHYFEIEKCYQDPIYFIENYIKIQTKIGVDFIDNRPYQTDFLNLIINPKNEAILGLLPRQAGKSVTVGEWGTWNFVFEKDIRIGIVANKGSMSREFLDKIKNMIINLPIWIKPGCVVWNKGSIKSDTNTGILTDVPSEGSFRGHSVNYIIVDETDWIDPKKFRAMLDALLPTQGALSKKKLILITTPNGKNQFYELWKDAGYTHEETKNGYLKFDIDWKIVPRYKTDGTLWEPEAFREYIIKREGITQFMQNYACSFQGSSQTLIPQDILDSYELEEPIETDKDILIYEEPIHTHKYIIGVDSAKEGQDFSAFQVFDFTDLRFKQVCSAKLKCDYLMLPEILNQYGLKYNQALIIIENNEGSGQSVADILKRDYEYENLFFEYKNSKRLKYPGFRTTKLSRDLMLQTVRMLAISERLKLCDRRTIQEFENFILVNNKYQAWGVDIHDDLVMATLLCFAIFNNVRNFEDFKPIVDSLKSGDSISTDILTIGSFADFNEEIEETQEKWYTIGF